MSVLVEEEGPRVSLFRAQLRSVLEILLNDAVTEITRVYHVSTSVNIFTLEEGDSPPQDQSSSSPPCKTDSIGPDVPASPPPAVPFKKEVLKSEPHPPLQHPTIVHVTSLARKDAGSQTDSCFSLQPSISTTAPLQSPVSTAPLKREVLDVCIGTPIDRDQAQLPESLSQGEVDNMEGEEHPGPSSASKGNADADQNQVASREDSQESVATQQETCDPLVLRARTVPRRPSAEKCKARCDNMLVNGSKSNPDQTSQSQTSCLQSASLTRTSKRRGPSSMLAEVLEDEPSALEGTAAATGQTSDDQHATRLKPCVVQLVKVNPFACHLCSKTFKLRPSLRRHLRFHTGEKPHACKQCGRSFALKGNLKNHHKIVHSGESPLFRCEYCVRQYCSESKLAVHVRVHTGEKPHRCDFCKKKHYRLKKNLVKHMLRHLGYGPAADQKTNHSRGPRPKKTFEIMATGSDNASRVGMGDNIGQ